MRNQYKLLAEKYEQIQESVVEARKPGTPKVVPYVHKDGTTAYKSLTKWGKRQDWSNSKAAHKAAGIPEPKQDDQINESLEPEASMFQDPETKLSLEVDDEDPNNGTLHYMGFEFPVSKSRKAGTIQYFVGNVASGKMVHAQSPEQFSKVLAAIDKGEIKPSTKSNSSMFSKVQRMATGEQVPVWYIRPKTGEYYSVMRTYMTNADAEKYILDQYRKKGNAIFKSGYGDSFDWKGDKNPLKGYATDNQNYTDEKFKYVDIGKWASKMNLADYRGGHKGANIIGHRSKE